MTDVYREVAKYIYLASRRQRVRFGALLPKSGPSINQWSVLFWVAEAGGSVAQSRIAGQMDLTESVVTRLADALVKRGLLEREVSHLDRRARVLKLTPLAKPLLEEGLAASLKSRGDTFGGIPEADLKTCLKVLRIIVDRP